MLNGVYGVAATMDGASLQHEMIARNLAHVQMPGYRRAHLIQGTFHDSLQEDLDVLDPDLEIGNQGVKASVDFTDGDIERTGDQFDVAIHGKGFFVVGEGDAPLYTRNGSFTLDPSGTLVTRDGRTVQGKNGPIKIGAEIIPSEINIDSTGRVAVGETEIGRLKIVDFEEKEKLVQVGTTLFQDNDRSATDLNDAHISQGFLERSNVHPVQELVDMIAVQRRYDSASKTLRALMRILEQRINLQGGR